MNYRLRLIVLSILDAFIIAAAIFLAYLLRFDFKFQPKYFALLPYVITVHIVLIFIAFNYTKMYRRVWQYASIGELVSLVKAVTAAELTFYVLHSIVQLNYPKLVVPRSIYFLAWILIILGVGGSRLAWRMFRDSYLKLQPHHRRTLIIGAG